MKSKRQAKAQALDAEGLAKLHGTIMVSMSELERLNAEFKEKQEYHFLKTYMGVIERMGN